SRPATPLPARLYFWRWARPPWHGAVRAAEILGRDAVEAVRTADGAVVPCDGVVVSGELVPNSELAVEAGLAVDMPGRRPVLARGMAWSEPGFFAAGNILGGFHGAEWCHRHGRKVARAVAA